MKKIICLALFILSTKISADPALDLEFNRLTSLLTDQYASLVEKSVTKMSDEKTQRVYLSFSIEGFNLGNNFQQFLAVFQKEYKVKQEPPFSRYGEPKYRLIGYVHLCFLALRLFLIEAP